MPDLAQRIAAVCREMERGDLQAIVAEIGAELVLQRVLLALTAAAAPDAIALGDDLDALDAQLIAYGIPGGLVAPTRRTYQPSPSAAGEPHPAIAVWTCPVRRCNRWLPQDPVAENGPVCTVRGTPMVEKRLSA